MAEPAIVSDNPIYTRTGPALLAHQGNINTNPIPVSGWNELYAHLQARDAGLYMWRLSWWQHWSLLAQYILPRRYHWLITPNTMSRGQPINQMIVDPTGTQAMRICASGLMSGLTSPSRPWFNIRPRSANIPLDHDAQIWLDETESRIYNVMATSNFYDSIAQMDEDLCVFGTAPMIIYDDENEVIRCYNPCAGEYFLATGSTFRVESLYRRFTLTVAQIVEMFGIENCPPEIQSLWATKGAAIETERTVAHAIEPNFPIAGSSIIKGDFPYREVYWLWGVNSSRPLAISPYRDAPFIAPRWATTSNDAYGRSPGMDVLPDIMQLQVMTRRKAEAIEKQVRPPLIANIELKNEPSSIVPGHVTYVTNLATGSGMRPIYEVQPELQYMTADIAAIQARIMRGFFNDLFLMLAETDPAKRMTATEVAQRQQEKLQVLGPVIERFQNEALSPAISRIVNIMLRRSLLPELPDSLKGVPLQINYISMLALAQKAAATASMERYAGMVGSMAAIKPEALDLIATDPFLREFGDMLLVPQKVIPAEDEVKQVRDARNQALAKQAAQQEAMQTGAAMVEGAKTLSETEVGAGQNALQLMLGT